jgi:BirA family biotin operon repressor/biotin-[acetyl-CoA-carboxylase] ligase|tara:strand:+ start:13484 stop:14254 length:771 start_codon:yes stop_codon:yes gene_type:complete
MLASRKNELLLGQTKLQLSSVDSTNNYAANMLKEGLVDHGTVILADEQTNGRGQRGSIWQSEAGLNLQMTLVLFPNDVQTSDQRFLNSLVSVSIIKLLERYGLKPKIKWPNDILINDQKIAGILIENQIRNGMIYSSLIGIGLNVNQLNFGSLPATSLRLETNVFNPISDVLDSLMRQMNFYYEKFKLNQFTELEALYYENLWGFEKLKNFNDKNGTFSGTIKGISDEGLLKIETTEGIRKYDIKEISFVLEEKNV